MRRRHVGVGAVKKKAEKSDAFTNVGKKMEEQQLSFVKEKLAEFKTIIERFAVQHKERINKDPEFRHQFHQMCVSIGVDPLASSKGFWADLLGVGDYYFSIAVRLIDFSVRERKITGGIVPLHALVRRLNDNSSSRKSHPATEVSEEDVRRAVDKIKILGSGFRILDVKGEAMVLSVPTELNADHTDVISLCQGTGYVDEGVLRRTKEWSRERYHAAIDPLVRDGLVWLDVHAGKTSIYFPSLWLAAQNKPSLEMEEKHKSAVST